MAWAKPLYTKGDIDRAGDLLIEWLYGTEIVLNYTEALQVINNWRSSHSYPLQSLKMNLRQRSKLIERGAVVAQRLKRLRSIAIKLRRNEKMALSQMQDIGGCRAILSTVRGVDDLVKLYENSNAKNPRDRSEFVKKFDYVAHPKDDGYRSVHLIYKYRTKSRQHRCYNGQRIEIQIRSRLQHAWATAVETVDVFSRQAIKTGGGTEDWRRFFLLMGSAIAMRERKPLVHGAPGNKKDLVAELKDTVARLRVQSVLEGWSAAIQELPVQATADARVFLLVIDPEAGNMKIVGFSDRQQAKASEAYLEAEKVGTATDSTAQAVLVSVESVRSLRTAYPNYFADTNVFIDAVNRAIS